MGGLPNGPNRLEERFEADRIEPVVRPDTRADVNAVRLNFGDRLRHVLRSKPARQVNGHIDAFANPAADAPVVTSPGSAQFGNREALIAGIEQDGIDVRRDAEGFVDRFFAGT